MYQQGNYVPNNDPNSMPGGGGNAIQNLGSRGAPANSSPAARGHATTNIDMNYPARGNAEQQPQRQYTSSSTSSAPPAAGSTTGPYPAPSTSQKHPLPNPTAPSATGQGRYYSGLSRVQTYGTADSELHIPESTPAVMAHQPPPVPSQGFVYQSPTQYSPASVHTIDSPSYGGGPSQNAVPGQLQAGTSARPPPASAQASFTAASATAPSMPQINTSALNPGASAPGSRSGTASASHSYSRSSPAGLEQKFAAFTPESSKYPTSTSQRYYPQTPSGPHSSSPLGLADIRTQLDESLLSTPQKSYAEDEFARQPTNSNYLAPWAVYAYDWCKWPVAGGRNSAGKMAIGSYTEEPHNYIQILDTQLVPQDMAASGAPGHGLEYIKVAEATCAYPVTRILWEPPSSQKESTDLLATSGDHLRLWSLPANPANTTSNSITSRSGRGDGTVQKLQPLALLSNSKTPEHTAPLTSLDWNTLSPKLIITSSIDTTCTIWDIPTLTAKTQLIAHDKEVFDVRFCAGSVDVFVSCGADGSVRMFDLRSLEHSTIIYEPSDKSDKDKGSSPGDVSPTKAQQTMHHAPPLLRLATSPHDQHLLATFASDSKVIRILDVRQPGQAVLELRGHSANVNSIEWSPTRRGMLASGGDDSLVLIWDLINNTGAPLPPGMNGASGSSAPTASGAGAGTAPGAAAAQSTSDNAKGPSASWRCEYEVGNLSWAPQGPLTTAAGGDWLGVSGGRGVWGVKL